MDGMADVRGGDDRVTLGRKRPWRAFTATVISVLVTVAVVGPMAYQAGQADDAGRTPTVTVPSAPTVPTTVPANVLGEVLTRDEYERGPAQFVPSQVPGDDIVFTIDALDGPERPLDGADVSGSIWIQVDRPDVAAVRFWLNDPNGGGRPDQVDRDAPFTLVSGPDDTNPAPLDVDELSSRSNTILVEITDTTGKVSFERASFSAAT